MRFHLTSLLTLCLLGCYDTRSLAPDVGSSDAGPPDARRADAPVEVRAASCDEAPFLPLDASVSLAASSAVSPSPDSCWDDAARIFYRLEIPPRTAVEITTEGDDAPIPSLSDRCGPGLDRCRRFGESGSFTPGERRRSLFYGNPEATTAVLVLSLSWPGTPLSAFRLTARSSPVAPNGRCEDAEPLSEGTLAPSSEARGGTYESWECWYLAESVFYETTLPAGHVALPASGSQPLVGRAGCGCEHALDPLVNVSESDVTLLLEADPSRPLGVELAPLPSEVRCSDAVELPLDGETHPLRPFPRLLAGVVASCVYNDPHHYDIVVPPRSSVEVELVVSSPYPEAWLVDGCRESCTAPERIERRPTGALVVVLPNDRDVAARHTLVVGAAGPLEAPLTGTITGRAL